MDFITQRRNNLRAQRYPAFWIRELLCLPRQHPTSFCSAWRVVQPLAAHPLLSHLVLALLPGLPGSSSWEPWDGIFLLIWAQVLVNPVIFVTSFPHRPSAEFLFAPWCCHFVSFFFFFFLKDWLTELSQLQTGNMFHWKKHRIYSQKSCFCS